MKTDKNCRRKRLLVLTSTFPRWKDDREPPFVFELCRRLAHDFEVTVLAPHARGALLRETMTGIRVRRFPYLPSHWEKLAYDGGIVANLLRHRWNYLVVPLFLASELLATIYLIRKYKVDAVHAHWIIPHGTLASIASKLSKSRPALACTMHGSDLFALRGHIFDWIRSWTARSLNCLAVVSHTMHKSVLELNSKAPVDIIPMGVDLQGLFTPPEAPSRRNPLDLLCVGRLVRSKGIHHVIAALPRILEQHPRARLTIVGDGPERGNLSEQIDRLNLQSSVQFAGKVGHQDLADHYRRATLLICASEQEGFGLVIAEAMGCECPVLAADLPALRDMITDGVTGTLCRQQDTADIAEKALGLLSHQEQAQLMAKAARAHVLKHFDWQSIAERYRCTLDAICDKSS